MDERPSAGGVSHLFLPNCLSRVPDVKLPPTGSRFENIPAVITHSLFHSLETSTKQKFDFNEMSSI
jgi:hypothetical protein